MRTVLTTIGLLLALTLFGTVGFRVDRIEGFGTVATWRVAPAYVIKETGTTLKGSVGTGFQAPSPSQWLGWLQICLKRIRNASTSPWRAMPLSLLACSCSAIACTELA